MNSMKLFTILFVCLVLVTEIAGQDTKGKYGFEAALRNTSWIKVGNDSSRIINGVDAVQNDHPWQISLQVNAGGEWLHICGAVLVSEDRALTAAHCLPYWGQLEHRVGLGYYDLRVGPANPNSQTISVADVTPHEQYSPTEPGYPNDIAILKFAEPAVLTDTVQKLEIPKLGENFDDAVCDLTGWGIFSTDGTLPPILQYAQFFIVPYQDCRRFWSVIDSQRIYSFRHICGFNYPVSACNGDSGGPLVCNNKIVGIVSWGLGNCSGCFPGVFTRVSSYYYWLRNNM